ncbi:MAG: UDP-glucose 4-epimerase GalE [Clostridiaceae bacterium]|nr:UDP-glucose 4-epimerase GalE [Clostridiaceae bacterium]
MAILVTGGAGYIGSHTCVELLDAGYEVIVVDNLSNSKEESLKRVREITGKPVKFYKADLLDRQAVNEIFKNEPIEAVMHFAGLKAVAESVSMPLRYYHNNITGTLTLLYVMQLHNVKKIVFSSSATVYGNPHTVPITEDFPLSAVNPYGQSKLIIERILSDLYNSEPGWNIAILRYFNPTGAHPSGRIGEDPNRIPNNLFPYITQVAVGKLKVLNVYGSDYDTPDGTGIRDYIHVVDLAAGHIKALQKLNENPGIVVYNLGTGRGYSVLEVVNTFSKVTGINIPFRFAERRPGDIATSFADPSKAKNELGWTAKYGLDEMCADAWRWQQNNPDGYK